MELLLESPLEALAFRYFATITGCIWTCLALFAAGIGLWFFRLLGSASRSASDSTHKYPSPADSPVIPPLPATSAPIASTMVMLNWGEREEGRSSTKGRFTAYLQVEDEIDGENEGEEVDKQCEWGNDGGDCLDLFDWRWRGDLGWYRYQDLTAINGSVVRLWDGGRWGSRAKEQWI